MKYSTQIKPISYLKAHASEMIRKLNEGGEPYIITQHGEAKAVVVSVESYEREQESLAFETIMKRAREQLAAGHAASPEDVFARLLKKYDLEDVEPGGEEGN